MQHLFVIQLIRTSAAKMENVKLSLVGMSATVRKDLQEKDAVSYWKQVIRMFLCKFVNHMLSLFLHTVDIDDIN